MVQYSVKAVIESLDSIPQSLVLLAPPPQDGWLDLNGGAGIGKDKNILVATQGKCAYCPSIFETLSPFYYCGTERKGHVLHCDIILRHIPGQIYVFS